MFLDILVVSLIAITVLDNFIRDSGDDEEFPERKSNFVKVANEDKNRRSVYETYPDK